ncbi:MAG: AMP-binding protein [Hasllibacter sp.]
MGWMADESGLAKGPANFVPLSPLSHLNRAKAMFPDREALVHGGRRWSYAEYHALVSRLASGLAARGVAPGDVVATVLPNTPAQVAAHFAVPACGAVINAINTRLDADTVGYILGHGGAKAVLVDTQFLPLVTEALARTDAAPLIIECPDPEFGFPATGDHPTLDEVAEAGDPGAPWHMPGDEWESLALNYTSGTTGRPKGVVYHHRGAYLMTMATPISWRMTLFPTILTIVPLFHCNGWNHSWMAPLVGAKLVCCRDVSAAAIYDAIADEGVTHFGGAPIVLNMLVNAREDERRAFDHPVHVFTAGAPPAPATLAGMERLGFEVTQVYGLTETYGHVTECTRTEAMDALEGDARAAVKARQGHPFPQMEGIAVHDAEGRDVPRDGATQGEIAIRGNSVMKGYLKNPDATAAAFAGGWFRSGDVAVMHPDGMVQIRDRAKDIIISGGENVSSVEVEGCLMAHPAVSLAAVVAKPDETWGEVPLAFVELKDGAEATEADLIAFARERLAGFKTPKEVRFEELPKTSTGKIQKFELRARA